MTLKNFEFYLNDNFLEDIQIQSNEDEKSEISKPNQMTEDESADDDETSQNGKDNA